MTPHQGGAELFLYDLAWSKIWSTNLFAFISNATASDLSCSIVFTNDFTGSISRRVVSGSNDTTAMSPVPRLKPCLMLSSSVVHLYLSSVSIGGRNLICDLHF